MNGDGSQEHPWEVVNLADLRSLVSVAQPGQYAKLMADIDCNEQCPGGWTTVTLNQHLDLNGHNIIAPLLLNENVLFKATSGLGDIYYTISNGGIINIFEEFQSQQGLFQTYIYNSSSYSNVRFKLYNLGISMFIRNNVILSRSNVNNAQNGRVCAIDKCTIKIMGNLNNCQNPLFTFVPLTNSKIICDYIANGSHMLCNSGTSRNDVQNCRFEGKVTGTFNLNDGNSSGESGMVNNGVVTDTIILTESTVNGNYHMASYSGKSIISSKCNSISPNPNQSYIIRMNDDDIKSYSAVNNAGFITIEV